MVLLILLNEHHLTTVIDYYQNMERLIIPSNFYLYKVGSKITKDLAKGK